MDATAVQFELLAEITEAFGDANVEFWLRGGWALDFLLGEVRPEHADIDLVAWRRDRDVIYGALTACGFEHDRELPEAAIDFQKNEQSIQVLLVEFNSDGALVCHGFESRPLPEGALDGPIRTINGVSCRTLAPHALLHEKETYEANRGRPLREKDHLSIRLLQRFVNPA
jgi:Zn ribbon nucleic-acid-binding protein